MKSVLTAPSRNSSSLRTLIMKGILVCKQSNVTVFIILTQVSFFLFLRVASGKSEAHVSAVSVREDRENVCEEYQNRHRPLADHAKIRIARGLETCRLCLK